VRTYRWKKPGRLSPRSMLSYPYSHE
jgi:hypothetical protein